MKRNLAVGSENWTTETTDNFIPKFTKKLLSMCIITEYPSIAFGCTGDKVHCFVVEYHVCQRKYCTLVERKKYEDAELMKKFSSDTIDSEISSVSQKPKKKITRHIQPFR